jgi:hypothetical protein
MYEYETFESLRLMDYVEAWFDNHPEPENIEFIDVTENCRIFYAENCHDIWMINLSFENMRAAAVMSSTLQNMSKALGITQILVGKRLFLFEDRRF